MFGTKSTKSYVKKIAIAFLPFALITGLFAENSQNVQVKALVKSQYYDDLVAKKIVTKSKSDTSKTFELLPEAKYSEIIKKTAVEKGDNTFPFTFEGLYLLNKAELLKTSNSSDTEITIDDVSRITRSVSKMQGMKYITSKNKEEVLYERCFTIADENGKTAVADVNTGNADGQVSYCLQDDAEYGVNRYKLTYKQSDDVLLAQFTILDVMGLGPFKAIYPEKMVISILVMDCGDDLLLYLTTDLDSKKYPGIQKMITDSMTARMNAVYNWFITQF